MSLLLIVLASTLAAPDKEQDLARLQGTWECVREHLANKDLPYIGREWTRRWTIKGKTITMTDAGTIRGTVRLDPTRSPGRYEWTNAAAQGAKSEGIYTLDGDTFRRCFVAPLSRAELPAVFPDKSDPRYAMDVWKRRDGAKGDGLEGTWDQVDFSVGAYHEGKEDLQVRTMTVKGDEYSIRSQKVAHGTITLDSSVTPKQIDILYTNMKLKGEINRGVYRLDGPRLTIAGSIRMKRPDKIPDNPEGDGHFEVFEKVEP